MPHGIARRVVLAALVSAALGASSAAIIAIMAVDRLLVTKADERLRGATIELRDELDEGKRPLSLEDLQEELADENGEIAPSGIRLAVYRGAELVAGDPSVPRPSGLGCSTVGLVGRRLRSCAQEHGTLQLVAASRSDEGELASLYLAAALTAFGLGATTGALLSLGLGRWAVAPLQRLVEGLQRSRADRLSSLDLGPESACLEVEAVRQALTALIVQLEVLLAQAERFAANAAHELRTPLTTLRAEIELLAEEGTGANRQALDRASQKVAALAALVERLLVLALPGPRLAEGFETVALEDVVEETLLELPAEQRRRVRFETSGEGLVRGDTQLLKALVQNALGNALKFAVGKPVEVRLAEAMDSAVVELQVCDQGPGIAPEQRDRVFEAFYHSHPSEQGGHGLGLALIGHIAKAHGGRAAFAPAATGACLVIALPRWTPRHAPGPAKPG